MSDAGVSEEIVVYGDAPDAGGGGTDTISIPLDMLTYYEPAGPTIINPPVPGGGGGGGDVVDPCEEFAETEEKAIWIAAGFGAFAILQPETAPVTGLVAIAFGLGAYYLGNAADDPPQPLYQRPAGSKIVARTVVLPGPAQFNAQLDKILEVERATALFVDAVECAQGAFLAGDAPWTQQHTESARDACLRCGRSLIGMAQALAVLGKQLPFGQRPPANMATELPTMIASVRPLLGLSSDDEARITEQLLASPRGVPSKRDVDAAAGVFHHLGQRLSTSPMIDIRFEFVDERPTASRRGG